MDVMLVVDMQVGLREGPPKYDLLGVVGRINALGAAIRRRGGRLVFIQHTGGKGDAFEPDTAGWRFLPELKRAPDDLVVAKTLNDPFQDTPLSEILGNLATERLLVTGWATDFCVDATVRRAVALGHRVVPVADAHTVSDRPHLKAPKVIEHHNWVWSGLIAPAGVEVLTTHALLNGDG
ncbi:isochorismatase family protein [Pleomorphomonas koreensis]|uniref:isochorismatase family protein n=1 Tax=Pleomorphomonas koreensis TaxID=257440 RepID=UPI0004228640|nr:isochorismatase family protein [Pleomorphomonas koreensis]